MKSRSRRRIAGWATILISAAVGTAVGRPAVSHAGPAAATMCPPSGFVTNSNLAQNPDFENGQLPYFWTPWSNAVAPSAATGWTMHTDNAGAPVRSRLVPSSVPAPSPGGGLMLHYVAGGGEGGIVQALRRAPSKLMFSAWVYVRKGHVVLQPNGGGSGPASWSTKTGEWEQLRACTDGTVDTNALIIYNQEPAGGEFFVDRVEVKETS